MSVYLANPNTKYDLSTLRAYGDVKYLVAGYLNPFNTDQCIKQLEEGLEYFDPERDWVCMTGNLLIVSLMMMVAYKKFPTFKVLMFDAPHSNYRERVLINDM